ncbi:MAG TPA: sugar ABC transporter substrate-binding protein [Clostridiaceae bacterium]|nr:sugar ABC transporter substrate-binding protein [Clostridiaceae bacterium]
MKKITSLVLALMLALSVAACGSKDDPAPETPETPGTEEPGAEEPGTEEPAAGLTGSITVQAEGGWESYYRAAIERFNVNNPDANIELLVTGSFDMLDILDSTDPSNPDVADVYAIPADRLSGLNAKDALAPMNAKAMAAAVGGFTNYDAGLGGNFNVDGDYLAFPMNIETLIVYANKANAEAQGVDLTKSIEMNDAGLSVLIPVFNAWYGVGVTNAADIELLGMEADGTLFSDMTAEWADLSADKQANIETIFKYWQASEAANVPLWDADATWGFMDEEFTTGGTGVARISGPWDAGAFTEQAGENLEIMPIGTITIAGKPMKHWKGGWGIAINSRNEGDDEKMALAEAFIVELMNTDFAVDFFKGTGKIMENVPADVYLNSDLSEQDKLIIENVLVSYQDAPARPLFEEWGSVWTTWETAILSWSSVQPADAEAAYKEIKAAFDAMMLNF